MSSLDSPPPKVRILGLPVSPVGSEGILACAASAVAEKRVLRIAVANHNKCWLALRDPVVRAFLEEAEIVAAETSVVWAARMLGRVGVEAAWGVVLMDRLLDQAGRERWSTYLLGATEDVNRVLAAKLSTRWPGVRLVGRHHGYIAGKEEAVRAEVVGLGPDLLLVAMGSPLQECFLASLPSERGPLVRVGVGGSFDVHAGLRRDAPGWVRGSGFEWLWRAAQSPRLLRRYLVRTPWFVAAVLRERWTGRAPGRRAR